MYIIKEKLEKLEESLFEFSLKDLEPITSKYKEFYNSFVDKNGFVQKEFIKKVINSYNIDVIYTLIGKTKKFIYYECSTKDLKSKDIDIANSLNPIPIRIQVSFNSNTSYIRDEEIILSIAIEDIEGLVECSDLDISIFNKNAPAKAKLFLKNLNECEHFVSHEITHWLDFTTNKFVKPLFKDIKKIAKINNIMFDLLISNPSVVEIASYFEINAQIHSIKTMRDKYKDSWDHLTIYDVINKNSSLELVYKSLANFSTTYANNWIKFILKRMYRENLLGKKMLETKSLCLFEYINRYENRNLEIQPSTLIKEIGKQEILKP